MNVKCRVSGETGLELSYGAHLIESTSSPFSPSGKLVQIEYALQAVAAGAPSIGIKGRENYLT